jgi:hypothetical protein
LSDRAPPHTGTLHFQAALTHLTSAAERQRLPRRALQARLTQLPLVRAGDAHALLLLHRSGALPLHTVLAASPASNSSDSASCGGGGECITARVVLDLQRRCCAAPGAVTATTASVAATTVNSTAAAMQATIVEQTAVLLLELASGSDAPATADGAAARRCAASILDRLCGGSCSALHSFSGDTVQRYRHAAADKRAAVSVLRALRGVAEGGSDAASAAAVGVLSRQLSQLLSGICCATLPSSSISSSSAADDNTGPISPWCIDTDDTATAGSAAAAAAAARPATLQAALACYSAADVSAALAALLQRALRACASSERAGAAAPPALTVYGGGGGGGGAAASVPLLVWPALRLLARDACAAAAGGQTELMRLASSLVQDQVSRARAWLVSSSCHGCVIYVLFRFHSCYCQFKMCTLHACSTSKGRYMCR